MLRDIALVVKLTNKLSNKCSIMQCNLKISSKNSWYACGTLPCQIKHAIQTEICFPYYPEH